MNRGCLAGGGLGVSVCGIGGRNRVFLLFCESTGADEQYQAKENKAKYRLALTQSGTVFHGFIRDGGGKQLRS